MKRGPPTGGPLFSRSPLFRRGDNFAAKLAGADVVVLAARDRRVGIGHVVPLQGFEHFKRETEIQGEIQGGQSC